MSATRHGMIINLDKVPTRHNILGKFYYLNLKKNVSCYEKEKKILLKKFLTNGIPS